EVGQATSEERRRRAAAGIRARKLGFQEGLKSIADRVVREQVRAVPIEDRRKDQLGPLATVVAIATSQNGVEAGEPVRRYECSSLRNQRAVRQEQVRLEAVLGHPLEPRSICPEEVAAIIEHGETTVRDPDVVRNAVAVAG